MVPGVKVTAVPKSYRGSFSRNSSDFDDVTLYAKCSPSRLITVFLSPAS
jgi:hypothetical protein